MYEEGGNAMSNQKTEVVINDVLKGDTKKNALDFVAYLNDSEMIVGENHSEVSYKDECICYIMATEQIAVLA